MKKILILFLGLLLTGCVNASADVAVEEEQGARINDTISVKEGYYVCDDGYIVVENGTVERCIPDIEEYFTSKYPEAEFNTNASQRSTQTYDEYISAMIDNAEKQDAQKSYTVVELPNMGEDGGSIILLATYYNENGGSVTALGYELKDENTIISGSEEYTYIGTELPQIS